MRKLGDLTGPGARDVMSTPDCYWSYGLRRLGDARQLLARETVGTGEADARGGVSLTWQEGRFANQLSSATAPTERSGLAVC